MIRIVEGAGGALLIAVVLSDVFRTVLVPRASRRMLRIGPLLGAMLLATLRRMVRNRSDEGGYELLSMLGPVLLVVNATVWFLLLIGGFSLLMYASRGAFTPPVDPSEAFYVSASSFLTLGVTGHAIRNIWTQGLIIGAGLSGFGVVPLVVTFLLNVQDALMQREQLVLRLGERDRSPPTALAILRRLAPIGGGRQDATERFLDDWDRWCADVILTHGAVPILVYFRSADHECDWLVALEAVLDATALLTVLGHDRVSELAADCHTMGSRLVDQLLETFDGKVEHHVSVSRSEFGLALEALADVGDDEHDFVRAQERYRAFEELRAKHAPGIAALCRHFGVRQSQWDR